MPDGKWARVAAGLTRGDSISYLWPDSCGLCSVPQASGQPYGRLPNAVGLRNERASDKRRDRVSRYHDGKSQSFLCVSIGAPR